MTIVNTVVVTFVATLLGTLLITIITTTTTRPANYSKTLHSNNNTNCPPPPPPSPSPPSSSLTVHDNDSVMDVGYTYPSQLTPVFSYQRLKNERFVKRSPWAVCVLGQSRTLPAEWNRTMAGLTSGIVQPDMFYVLGVPQAGTASLLKWITQLSHTPSTVVVSVHSDEDRLSYVRADVLSPKIHKLIIKRRGKAKAVIFNVLLHWLSMLQCLKYIRRVEFAAGRRYKMLTKVRADMHMLSSVRYEDFGTDPNTVYIPRHNDYEGGINDQFAIGGRRVMGKYLQLYTRVHEALLTHIRFHPESNLREWLVKVNATFGDRDCVVSYDMGHWKKSLMHEKCDNNKKAMVSPS